MRRLLVGLLVPAALLVGVDRVAVRVVESAVAQQVRDSSGLQDVPAVDVDVRGFPFLTQALRGRYDDVRVHTSGEVAGLSLAALDVDLSGVQVPLSAALSGEVAAVPVDGVRGSALLSSAYLSTRRRGVTVRPEGDRLRVTGRVEVLGRTLTASALSRVRLQDGAVVVRAEEVAGVPLGVLGDRLDLRLRVGTLPFGLRLSRLAVTPDGVRLVVQAGPTVLRR